MRQTKRVPAIQTQRTAEVYSHHKSMDCIGLFWSSVTELFHSCLESRTENKLLTVCLMSVLPCSIILGILIPQSYKLLADTHYIHMHTHTHIHVIQGNCDLLLRVSFWMHVKCIHTDRARKIFNDLSNTVQYISNRERMNHKSHNVYLW